MITKISNQTCYQYRHLFGKKIKNKIVKTNSVSAPSNERDVKG